MAESQPTILCGDIGGSNTRFALADTSGNKVVLGHRRQFENDHFTGLEALLERYLAEAPKPSLACLAVAGPTDGRSVRLTNLAWDIDADALSHAFGFPFRLVNDFEAVAWGLDALTAEHCHPLQQAVAPTRASRLAIGPGTGLGVAYSVWTEAGYRPMPGEGGHIGFAPADDQQATLLTFLQGRYGRVSVERILSGPGIVDLYGFCSGSETARTAAEVTRTALDASDPVAIEAMQIFCRILGQTAGDLALAGGTRGGVFIAGGIPARILPLLEAGGLLAGFRDKGRFATWMREVPLTVVTDPDVGLKGAALAR